MDNETLEQLKEEYARRKAEYVLRIRWERTHRWLEHASAAAVICTGLLVAISVGFTLTTLADRIGIQTQDTLAGAILLMIALAVGWVAALGALKAYEARKPGRGWYT